MSLLVSIEPVTSGLSSGVGKLVRIVAKLSVVASVIPAFVVDVRLIKKNTKVKKLKEKLFILLKILFIQTPSA